MHFPKLPKKRNKNKEINEHQGRVRDTGDLVEQMDKEGFGGCTNYGECEVACPKGISIKFIGKMNRDYLAATLSQPLERRGEMKIQ